MTVVELTYTGTPERTNQTRQSYSSTSQRVFPLSFLSRSLLSLNRRPFELLYRLFPSDPFSFGGICSYFSSVPSSDCECHISENLLALFLSSPCVTHPPPPRLQRPIGMMKRSSEFITSFSRSILPLHAPKNYVTFPSSTPSAGRN